MLKAGVLYKAIYNISAPCFPKVNSSGIIVFKQNDIFLCLKENGFSKYSNEVLAYKYTILFNNRKLYIRVISQCTGFVELK